MFKINDFNLMKFTIGLLLLNFFGMWYYAQSVKSEVYTQNHKIQYLNEQIDSLNVDIEIRDSLIVKYEYKQEITKRFVKDMFSSNFYNARLTGYHPVKEQTDSTPDITADGTKFDIHRAGDYRYVALSRDLLITFNRNGAKIRYGDYIVIKGTPNGKQDGIYQVRDTMNKRHTDWIDILLTPGQDSFYYRNVLMYKVTDPMYLDVIEDIYDQTVITG